MLTRCPHDSKPCPHGGCSAELCSRHEWVPAASRYTCDDGTPARATRNTPPGAAMRGGSPAPGAQSGPGMNSRRLWQL